MRDTEKVKISDEAVEAAARVMYAQSWAPNITWEDVRFEYCALMRASLAAAAPHMLAEVTASSPRMPSEIRNQVFEILGDFMDKFELVSRVQGPSRHFGAPGYEWGDMCGYVERRAVAALRVATAYRSQE